MGGHGNRKPQKYNQGLSDIYRLLSFLSRFEIYGNGTWDFAINFLENEKHYLAFLKKVKAYNSHQEVMNAPPKT